MRITSSLLSRTHTTPWRRYYSLRAPVVTIGIRREDPARIWERRCPLTPSAVKSLIVDNNVRVVVEHCARRVYPSAAFEQAGAQVSNGSDGALQDAHIIIGIKEPPISQLMLLTSPVSHSIHRTHLMFSHTFKGQSYNLPLLQQFLSNGNKATASLCPTLIDYELLTSPPPNAKRLVGFGYFAGVAGLVEGLVASALDHLSQGIASPFLHLPRPYTQPTLSRLHKELHAVSSSIREHGTPKEIGPFVLTLTGSGNVAKGITHTLIHLPTQFVTAEELPALVSDPSTSLTKIYVLHATPSTYLINNSSNKPFSKTDYYANPSNYVSEFHTKIAPYTTLLLNGIGWQPGFPRLMSTSQFTQAMSQVVPARRMTVADITCDIKGGLEFVDRATTIDEPTFRIPSLNTQTTSIDILPSELPLDASKYFSRAILPYVRTLVHQYQRRIRSASFEFTPSQEPSEFTDDKVGEIEDALDRAIIAHGGVLKEKHKWLYEKLISMSPSSEVPSPLGTAIPAVRHTIGKKKRVLLLGSGMVARPFVDQLCTREDVQLLVASDYVSDAERLVKPYPNASAKELNATDEVQVSQLVNEADVVVSLLPPPFHPAIAAHCIRHNKHLVTASYISPDMRALDESAHKANVLLLSEIGLDPGLDHCSAVSLLYRVRSLGLRPISFTSFCGGLPSPEFSNVPLGYKFSWSPLGMLRATLNSATFKLQNQVVNIPAEELLKQKFDDLKIVRGLRLEGIANRDSLPYVDEYGLGDDNVRTVMRGTLRYPGFSTILQACKSLGLLDTSRTFELRQWTDLMPLALSNVLGMPIKNQQSCISAAHDRLGTMDGETWATLNFLGLIKGDDCSSISDLPSLPTKAQTAIEYFALLLSHKLRYGDIEQDMVLLSHEVIAQSPPLMTARSDAASDTYEEVFTSTLITNGKPSLGESAMSRTVGLPLAFATREVLDDRVSVRGVKSGKEVWQAVLKGMEQVGVVMQESRRRVRHSGGMTLEDALVEGRQRLCN